VEATSRAESSGSEIVLKAEEWVNRMQKETAAKADEVRARAVQLSNDILVKADEQAANLVATAESAAKKSIARAQAKASDDMSKASQELSDADSLLQSLNDSLSAQKEAVSQASLAKKQAQADLHTATIRQAECDALAAQQKLALLMAESAASSEDTPSEAPKSPTTAAIDTSGLQTKGSEGGAPEEGAAADSNQVEEGGATGGPGVHTQVVGLLASTEGAASENGTLVSEPPPSSEAKSVTFAAAAVDNSGGASQPASAASPDTEEAEDEGVKPSEKPKPDLTTPAATEKEGVETVASKGAPDKDEASVEGAPEEAADPHKVETKDLAAATADPANLLSDDETHAAPDDGNKPLGQDPTCLSSASSKLTASVAAPPSLPLQLSTLTQPPAPPSQSDTHPSTEPQQTSDLATDRAASDKGATDEPRRSSRLSPVSATENVTHEDVDEKAVDEGIPETAFADDSPAEVARKNAQCDVKTSKKSSGARRHG
jgi:hypothetical protein